MVAGADVLIALLINLVSSALWEVIRDPLFSGDTQEEPEDGGWDAVVGEALDDAVTWANRIDDTDQEAVRAFLDSTEARQIVRQLFYSRADGATVPFTSLRQTFAVAFGRRHPERAGDVDAYGLFDTLVAACDRVLDQAMRQDRAVEAHEAKSAARHSATQHRLRAVEEQLRLLNARGAPDLPAIDAFAASLARAVIAHHEKIIPPNLAGAEEVPLDSIYVAPRFRSADEELPIEYEGMLQRRQRLVVLGNPGGGKTTFARKACLDLAQRRARMGGGLQPVLLFVELRKYVTHIDRNPSSIRDYLAVIAESVYQLDVPTLAFEYLLVSGRVGVVFDGLDELPVVGRRRDAKTAIEAFAHRYPQAVVLVTSRVVGYEYASLDGDIFGVSQLDDFTREQAAEYARRWFRLDGRLTTDEQQRRAEDFTDESDSVPDLRANPLMLGLMCNLYRGRGYLPRNRPDVYDKCATLLFEAWDKHRGIEVLRPFEDLLRPTMRYLAHWIYTTPELQSGISEDGAVHRTREFLAEWRYTEDPLAAERAARQFIGFCRGRAWVFSDLGTDRQDRSLFQFTHRTFLEFFAAEQVVQERETTKAVAAALRPRILAGEWEVVAQLVLQMQQRRHLGAADSIIEVALAAARANQTAARRTRAVLFATRALQGVVPRPQTVRAVVDALLEHIQERLGKPQPRDMLPALVELWRTDAENRKTVARQWQDTLDRWSMGAPDERSAAVELVSHGPDVAEDPRAILSPEARSWWSNALEAIRESRRPMVVEAAQAGLFDAGLDAVKQRWWSLGQLVETFGADALFRRRLVRVTGEYMPSAAVRVLREPLDASEASSVVARLCDLPTPWFDGRSLDETDALVEAARLNVASVSTLELFLLASFAEPVLDGYVHSASEEFYERLQEVEAQAEENDESVPFAVRVLLARGDTQAADDLRNELGTAVHSPRARDVLVKWVRGELSLVR